MAKTAPKSKKETNPGCCMKPVGLEACRQGFFDSVGRESVKNIMQDGQGVRKNCLYTNLGVARSNFSVRSPLASVWEPLPEGRLVIKSFVFSVRTSPQRAGCSQ